jgi:hypothetical protein
MQLTQPQKFIGGAGDFIYEVPVYDQDYEIKLSYPDTTVDSSYSGLLFPDHKAAANANLIEEHTYNWTGLKEEEKEVFELFFVRFNNSWQPFTLTYGTQVQSFIINNDPVIDCDRIGLYSLTLTLIKI